MMMQIFVSRTTRLNQRCEILSNTAAQPMTSPECQIKNSIIRSSGIHKDNFPGPCIQISETDNRRHFEQVVLKNPGPGGGGGGGDGVLTLWGGLAMVTAAFSVNALAS